MEVVENLCWLERRAGKDSLMAYLVQAVNELHCVIVLKAWHVSPILLPIQYVAELILELGSRPVTAMGSLARSYTRGVREAIVQEESDASFTGRASQP